MKYQAVIGVDVSKASFNAAAHIPGSPADRFLDAKFASTPEGFAAFAAWVGDLHADLRTTLICVENTGVYHRALVERLLSCGAQVWIVSALEVKWSGGMRRGKTDKLDARQVCRYAVKHPEKARLLGADFARTRRLADLMAQRERLQQARKSLEAAPKEYDAIGLSEAAAELWKYSNEALAAIEKTLKRVDGAIEELIASDEGWARSCQLARSVPGVGFVTAAWLLVYTHGFQRFDNPRQLACFAGVAPFPFQSGTSVKGKTRVHHMANKTLKTTLHMGAMAAVRVEGELKAYYERKVRQGKAKMSVLNAVRNKILSRVLACVTQDRPYAPRLEKAAA